MALGVQVMSEALRLKNNHPIARRIRTIRKYKKHLNEESEPNKEEKRRIKYCNVCKVESSDAWDFCKMCFEMAECIIYKADSDKYFNELKRSTGNE